MIRLFFASLATATLLGGAAMAGSAQITQTLTDIAAGADRHDWPRVRAAFADNVTTDYTGLWGGEPVSQAADELVAGWAAFLPGFDSTHHMVSNQTVTDLTATTAKAEADFTATHRIADALWVLGGRYSYELTLDGTGWRVTAMTMTPLWETGDRALVGQAAERAAAAQ